MLAITIWHFPSMCTGCTRWKWEICIDLGDRQFMAVEPVIRDLRTTLWGFDTGERVLFPGDGFAYSHYHWDDHCGNDCRRS